MVVVITVDGLGSYYLTDPKATMPTIRRLMREGASAGRMKCSYPTMTWPNHATLVTGVQPARHGVIANSYFDRRTNGVVQLIPDPIFDKTNLVKAPTVYDLAHDAGLRTAAVTWPASRNAPTLDWRTPDVGTDALFQKYSTPSLLEELKAAEIPYEMQGAWCKAGKSQDRDWMYTRIATNIVEKHLPNLLLFHLVDVDYVQHDYGPQSPAAYRAIEFADSQVQKVLDSISRAGLDGRVTVIVCSDHGFAPYRQAIQPNVVLMNQGWVSTNGTNVVARKAYALAQGASCFLYVLDQENRAEILSQMIDQFRRTEGVKSIIEAKDFGRLGFVDPSQDPRVPDLVLIAKAGFAFSDATTRGRVVTPPRLRPRGIHGQEPDNPMVYGVFVAWGWDIRAGATTGEISNVDVAPTVAHLLGFEMPNVEGKVLRPFLQK
jgi:predicted AlkP superfamily pyrophosphatase or phosphodiesterase